MTTIPFFRAGDPGEYLPTDIAIGPWGATVTGRLLGGLMARECLKLAGPELAMCRMTVDLTGRAAPTAVAIHGRIRRSGSRAALIDVEVTQDQNLVGFGRSVFLMPQSPETRDAVAVPSVMPFSPPATVCNDDSFGTHLWSAAGSRPEPRAGLEGWASTETRRYVWLAEQHSLVDEEEIEPEVRVVMAADIASPMSHWGPDGLSSINADYTVTFARPAVGRWIGMSSDAPIEGAGISTSTASIHDRSGCLGHVLVTATSARTPPTVP